MDKVYTLLTPTPLIFQNRSWAPQGSPEMGPSNWSKVETGPPNVGPPGSFPSILGKKGENFPVFFGSVFFQIPSGTRTFWWSGPEICCFISDSWGFKFRPALPGRRATRTDARWRQAKHQFLARSPNTESTAPRGGG